MSAGRALGAGELTYAAGYAAAVAEARAIAIKWRDENKIAAAKARKRDSRLSAAGFDSPGMADQLDGAAIECNAIADAIARLTPTPDSERAGGSEAGERQRVALLDLLAVIHRDGGHKTQAIGWELAAKQAMQIVANLHARTPTPERAGGWQQEQVEELAKLIPEVTQADIDMANDYLSSAFRCTATLAERFARHRLATLVQPNPEAGAVEAVARRAYAMRPIKVISQTMAEVTGKPLGAELSWDDIVDGGGNHDGLLWIVGNVLAALAQPTGEQPEAVERVAKAIKSVWDARMQQEADASDGAMDYEPGPWQEWEPEAKAAVAAMARFAGGRP